MILYSDAECLFNNNGYGRLAEAIRAEAVEEINGEYTLEVDYPINGKHYGDIAIGRLILAPHEDSDDLQPFRIYRISRPISGRVTVYARHISYDLATIPILPFTATGAAATVAALQNNRYFGSAFQFSTDLDTTYTFTLTTPATVRQVMGGMDDSILSVFGGEWEFDRFNVRLLAKRGEDKGVRIRYGKNLTDLVRDTDIDGRYSAIMPYYVNGETGQLVTLPELTLPIPGAMTYSGTYRNEDGTAYDNGTEDYTGVTAQTRIYPLDLSAEFWDAPSVAKLREAAQKKLRKYAGAGPADNLKVSFVNLWQTEEYKNYAPLQSVCIGDTVEVYYSALGVTVNMRVIRTVYDLINKRYNAIELGNPAYNMSNAVTGISEGMAQAATRNAIAKATRAAASIADAQTQLIAGQEGGNFVIDRDASGRPTGWLIMDTADKSTAEHVLRANLSGIGYSPNGYNGPFTTAWTIDGKFNADFIQTGALNADLIKAGSISDAQGKFYLDMTTGQLSMQDGTFTGTVNATSGTIGDFSISDGEILYDLGGGQIFRITPGYEQGNFNWLLYLTDLFGVSSDGGIFANRGVWTNGYFDAVNSSERKKIRLQGHRILFTNSAMTQTFMTIGRATYTHSGLSVEYDGIELNNSNGFAIGFYGNTDASVSVSNGAVDINEALYVNNDATIAGYVDVYGNITADGTNVLSVQPGEAITVKSVQGVFPAVLANSSKTIRIVVTLPRIVTGRSVSVSSFSGLYLRTAAGGAIYYGSTGLTNLSALPSGVTIAASVSGYNTVNVTITGANAFVTTSGGRTAVTNLQTITAIFSSLVLSFS